MYTSTANIQLKQEDLQVMLTKYRQNNQRNGITGLLLYSGENFVQLIEGEEEPIKALFGKIQQDPVHRNIIPLANGPVPHRLFSDWSLGFKVVSGDEVAKIRGYINPTEPNFLQEKESQDQSPAIKVLQDFAQHNLTNISYL